MNKKYVSIIILGVVIFLVLGLCIYTQNYVSDLRTKNREIVRSLKKNFTLQAGIIQSPPVIIEINNITDFVSKAVELSCTVVYVENKYSYVNLYIFSPGYQIAFRFVLPGGLLAKDFDELVR